MEYLCLCLFKMFLINFLHNSNIYMYIHSTGQNFVNITIFNVLKVYNAYYLIKKI